LACRRVDLLPSRLCEEVFSHIAAAGRMEILRTQGTRIVVDSTSCSVRLGSVSRLIEDRYQRSTVAVAGIESTYRLAPKNSKLRSPE